MFSQENFVSVLQVTLPRNCDSGTSPQQTTESSTQRSNVRKATIFPLYITHRTKVSSQKLRYVRQVRSRTGEYGNISCPSQTFVPLRAVGGDRHKIGKGRPSNILPQLIYFLVRCFVTGSQLVNGAKHYSFHRCCGKGFINTGYFHKAITMIGETGKNRFFTSFSNIDVLCHGSTDIL